MASCCWGADVVRLVVCHDSEGSSVSLVSVDFVGCCAASAGVFGGWEPSVLISCVWGVMAE